MFSRNFINVINKKSSMNRKKLLNLHSSFAYTYYIKVKVNCKDCDGKKIYKKLGDYLHSHDRNSHFKSVKEYDENSQILRYYVLYFTDKELDYSRVQKKMSSDAFVHIQLVPKTKEDIENIIDFMEKIRKNNKQISKNIVHKSESQVSNLDPKLSPNSESIKVIPKLSIFDFAINSKSLVNQNHSKQNILDNFVTIH